MTTSTALLGPELPLPPSLPTWNPLGHVLRFKNQPLELLNEAFDRCGDVARLWMGVRWMNVISAPAGVQRVLVDGAARYTKKTAGSLLLRKFLGQGLLTAEGARWKQQRRIATPAFHPQKIAAFVPGMRRAAEEVVERWVATPGERDIAGEMNRLTLRIAGETLFSMDISRESSEIGQALDGVMSYFLGAITNPLLAPFPTRARRRFEAGVRTLDRVVLDIIARRRQDPEKYEDLLGLFMQARDEETGEGMSDLQLRDEVLTMLLAGHETTSNALAWALYRLARHPEVQETAPARAEAVVKETMRLHPPAWILARKAEEEDSIEGYRIPAGTFVFVSPYLMHRHPRYWADPLRFDPSRFEGDAGKDRPKFVYFPFGAGPRRCIGENFALAEARTLLGTLTEGLRFIGDGHEVLGDPSVTLRPRGGLRLRVERR